jgi:hypothetical protein
MSRLPYAVSSPCTVPARCATLKSMPNRSSKPDVVQNAKRVFDQAVAESEAPVSRSLVLQVMREMGRKGGRIGGKRRLVTMTAERRQQIASDAAKSRWAKARAKTAAKSRKKSA